MEKKRIAEKVLSGERITADEAMFMWQEAPLWLLGKLAVQVKKAKSQKMVFYNRNFHLEPTNICRFECKFCSYRRDKGAPDAWDKSIPELLEEVRCRRDSGATEIHIVGGVHPDHNLDFYLELIRGIKQIMPDVAVKAFTAVEIDYMIKQAGLSLRDGLQLLMDAGMSSIPGGGAEIFDPEIRKRICPQKCSAEEWLAVHDTAHRMGMDSNATMLYGHVEKLEHRISHLLMLREQQDKTGGFNAFIPLKYRNLHNSMSKLGETTIVDDMRTLAMSRIILDNFDHVKAYWVMYGKDAAEMALAFGADDLDGTIDDSTKIYSMAGAEDQRPRMSVSEIEAICRRSTFTAVERDTHYNVIKH